MNNSKQKIVNKGKWIKGHIPWNKDLTAETDNRVKEIADNHRGCPRLDMMGDKNPAKRPEVRKKLRENNPMLKKENREKVRISKIELWSSPIKREKMMESMRGIPKTDEAKENISKAKIRYYKEHPEMKDILREKTIQQRSSGKISHKETSIERKVEDELQQRNINYQKQFPLCKISIVDFYLPESKTVIYCDGDYWHNLPGCKEKDERQTKVLTSNGYKVFRFWEHEINKSVSECLDRV